MIKTDISGAGELTDLSFWREKASCAFDKLSAEKDFAGWLHLPSRSAETLEAVLTAAERIRRSCEVLLVIGIGGSYLGAKAAIELLRPKYAQNGSPEIIFAGNSLSGAEAEELCRWLETKDFMINVVSKSGTTTEPALAMRIFYSLLVRKYGADAPSRVIATTDAQRGSLRRMADELGFESFVIPADVGGRFSVFTPAGLLPAAAAGADVSALLAGARAGEAEYLRKSGDNPAAEYAAARRALYAAGKKLEVLGYWEPSLRWFGEWWKQLFGESEGKGGKGIFPVSLEYSADLHSMGQYMQQGERIMFETMLSAGRRSEMLIPALPAAQDGFDCVSGKTLNFVNETALKATLKAHTDGGVPCIFLSIGDLTPTALGGMFFFFETACALSAYMQGAYPFDQPGVEYYKKNMFSLLGRN